MVFIQELPACEEFHKIVIDFTSGDLTCEEFHNPLGNLDQEYPN